MSYTVSPDLNVLDPGDYIRREAITKEQIEALAQNHNLAVCAAAPCLWRSATPVLDVAAGDDQDGPSVLIPCPDVPFLRAVVLVAYDADGGDDATLQLRLTDRSGAQMVYSDAITVGEHAEAAPGVYTLDLDIDSSLFFDHTKRELVAYFRASCDGPLQVLSIDLSAYPADTVTEGQMPTAEIPLLDDTVWANPSAVDVYTMDTMTAAPAKIAADRRGSFVQLLQPRLGPPDTQTTLLRAQIRSSGKPLIVAYRAWQTDAVGDDGYSIGARLGDGQSVDATGSLPTSEPALYTWLTLDLDAPPESGVWDIEVWFSHETRSDPAIEGLCILEVDP